MADAMTTFSTVSRDAVDAYIATKMIELNERRQVLQKICDVYPLEQKMSKTMRVVRFKRLSLPDTELVEGVTPSTNALELEEVNVTVKQWGIVALLTDVVQVTVKHPMLQIAIERVAMAMAETEEREAAQVLMSGTNVSYPGSVTSRSGLVASDVLNSNMVFKITARLGMRGAPRNEGATYMGIFQYPHKYALESSDQTFIQASAFSKYRNLQYGFEGDWAGVSWSVGNFLPQFVGVAAATTAAATATKAQYTVGTSGTLATGNYQAVIVGRELTTNYERRISVQSGNIAVVSPGSIEFVFPSSTNYVYDLYLTVAGGTTAYKVASRKAASSSYTVTTAPTGTETVAPVAPALGVSVFPGWIFGRGAFGVCKLNGMSLQTFVTPNGASDSDPLNQRKKVGAKYMQHFFILDNNFFERFETSSDIDAFIPA